MMWCISGFHATYAVLSILQVFLVEEEWLHICIYIVQNSSKCIEFAL